MTYTDHYGYPTSRPERAADIDEPSWRRHQATTYMPTCDDCGAVLYVVMDMEEKSVLWVCGRCNNAYGIESGTGSLVRRGSWRDGASSGDDAGGGEEAAPGPESQAAS